MAARLVGWRALFLYFTVSAQLHFVIMSNISLLFQLPSAWLVVLLSEWLDLPSIGNLDTAASSKQDRSLFLYSLQIMRTAAIDRFGLDKNGLFMGTWWRWLSLRKVFSERMNLRGHDVRSDLVIPSMRDITTNDFGDDDVHYLVRNCPSLRSINLKTCSNPLGPTGIRKLIDLHATLEEFSLCGNSGINQTEEYDIDFAAALVDVLRHCPRLRKVSFMGGALHYVDLADLIPFGHLFHDLQLPAMGEMPAYGQAVSKLLVTCSNLSRLIYTGADAAQDALALAALRHCPLLDELVLFRLRFNQLEQIAGTSFLTLVNRHCKQFRKLTAVNCEVSVPSIAGVASLKDLFFYQCTGFPAEHVTHLASMRLTHLNIDHVEENEWTGSCLESFVGSNISQTLEVFELDMNGIYVDDMHIALVLATCPNLRQLSVGAMFGDTGVEGLQAMAVGCPLLTEVSLHLTPHAVQCLGTAFANLKKCSIRNRSFNGVGSPVVEGALVTLAEVQTLYPAVEWGY